VSIVLREEAGNHGEACRDRHDGVEWLRNLMSKAVLVEARDKRGDDGGIGFGGNRVIGCVNRAFGRLSHSAAKSSEEGRYEGECPALWARGDGAQWFVDWVNWSGSVVVGDWHDERFGGVDNVSLYSSGDASQGCGCERSFDVQNAGLVGSKKN
jgi:hypothetical protein